MQSQIEKLSDKELVEVVKSGCELAFEVMVKRHESRVFGLALRLTKNQEDAEEVLQDVFTTVYRKLDSFKGNSAFSSWIYRITANAAFMKLRKRRQKPTTSLEDLSVPVREVALEESGGKELFSEAGAELREMRESIEDAVNKLPDQYRQVFILRDIDLLSSNEVSAVLDLSVPAVKSRLHRSRELMKKRLKNYWREYKGETFIVNPTKHTIPGYMQ